jgi:hypothetical protein
MSLVSEQTLHQEVLTLHPYIQSREPMVIFKQLCQSIAYPVRYHFPAKTLPHSFHKFITSDIHNQNMDKVLQLFELNTDGCYYPIIAILRVIFVAVFGWFQFGPTTGILKTYAGIISASASLVVLIFFFMKLIPRVVKDKKAMKAIPELLKTFTVPGISYELVISKTWRGRSIMINVKKVALV